MKKIRLTAEILKFINDFRLFKIIFWKNKNQKENNKKKDTKNNNILTYNHRLVYNDNFFKNKQNHYKNVTDNNFFFANNFNKNNPGELKRIRLNKNILSLKIDDKICSNSVYRDIIPKENFNVSSDYLSFRKNNVRKNDIYKTLSGREKEKENNISSKLLKNKKINLLKNFSNYKYINSEININNNNNNNNTTRAMNNNDSKRYIKFNNLENKNNISSNSVFTFNKNMNLKNLNSLYGSANFIQFNTSLNNEN